MASVGVAIIDERWEDEIESNRIFSQNLKQMERGTGRSERASEQTKPVDFEREELLEVLHDFQEISLFIKCRGIYRIYFEVNKEKSNRMITSS